MAATILLIIVLAYLIGLRKTDRKQARTSTKIVWLRHSFRLPEARYLI